MLLAAIKKDAEIADLKAKLADAIEDRDEWRERARARNEEADKYSKRAWAAEAGLAAALKRVEGLEDAIYHIDRTSPETTAMFDGSETGATIKTACEQVAARQSAPPLAASSSGAPLTEEE